MDTANKAVTDKIAAITACLPGWFTHLLAAGPPSDADAVIAQATAIAQALQKKQYTSAALTGATGLQDAAHVKSGQLAAIGRLWPALSAALTGGGDPNVGTDTANLLAQGDALSKYQDAVAQLDEALTGDMSRFVGDQVRLFYFTDVERLMDVLNGHVRHHRGPGRRGDPGPAGPPDPARRRGRVAGQLRVVADAKTQLRTIQDRFARPSPTPKTPSATPTPPAHDSTLPKPARRPPGPGSRQRPRRRHSPGLGHRRADRRGHRARPRSGGRPSATTAADTANSNSQATLSALQTDSATLPAKLMQAQQDLSAAQATLDQQRVLAADNAQDEAQAFGAFRTTSPS